ncbi:TPA: hypothetical protein VJS49_001800, partial [Streptococcus pyogenes]|nr:hypothetical protein [Streptococcus pyogenes]
MAGPENTSIFYFFCGFTRGFIYENSNNFGKLQEGEWFLYFLEEDDIFGIAKVHFIERERFGVFIVYFEEWYGDGQTNHVEIQGAEHSPCLSQATKI